MATPRGTTFRSTHELTYALKISGRDPHTKAVVSVSCLFCVHFGREDEDDGDHRRKRTRRTKFWVTGAFKTENYTSHHLGQHAEQWAAYQAMSVADKRAIFKKADSTATVHFQLKSEDALRLVITNKAIVNTIILDMFFDQDDLVEITMERVKNLCEEAAEDNAGEDLPYWINIRKPLQFNLAVDFIALSMSFRQVEGAILRVKERTGNALLGSLSDSGASDIARIVIALNLEVISKILNRSSTWAFSIANDTSTHHGISYFDQRVRFHLNGIIYNFHVVAFPIFDRHTSNNMARWLVKFLNALVPNWRSKLFNYGPDGENTMTGRHTGVVTQIDHECLFRLIRTWCGLHQLDIHVKKAVLAILGGDFHVMANRMVSWLRKQGTLITEMGIKCPKLTTRWVAYRSLTNLLLGNRVRLLHFINEKSHPNKTPSSEWWIILAVLHALLEQTNITFRKLQGRSMLVSQQKAELERLAGQLCVQFDVSGPINDELPNPTENSIIGRFYISNNSLSGIVADQGSWATELFETLDQAAQSDVRFQIASTIIAIVDNLCEIQAERNEDNLADDDLPPVLPHVLVRLRPRDFAVIVSRFRDSLQPC